MSESNSDARDKPVTAEFSARWAQAESTLDLACCSDCRACSLRCTASVPATEEEWAGIRRLMERAPEDRQAEIARVLAQSKGIDLGDDVTITMCQFFDMDAQSCVVYEARPLVCRLLGFVEWMPCPIERVERPLKTPEALALVAAYTEKPRRTLEEWAGDLP